MTDPHPNATPDPAPGVDAARPLRVLYAGTPETAVPVLRALLGSEHEVVGVLTRPDAPVGRKRVLTPSPVARTAEAAGVPVLKADRLRGEAGTPVLDEVRALAPDVAVVVAYGALVPADALEIPAHGWLNLHFSRLPAYRGAAPVQRALMDGAESIGADVFRLEEGLDTGPVLARLERPVDPGETSGEVLADLAERGGPLVLQVLADLAAGTAVAVPQEGEPTHAAKLTAADGLVDPGQDVRTVAARINGVTPEPGAWGWLVPADRDDAAPARLKLAGVLPVAEGEDGWPADLADVAPGAVVSAGGTAWLRTHGGAVRLGRVQPAGKKEMAAADWLRGLPAPVALLGGDALQAHQEQQAEAAQRRAAEREQARAAAQGGAAAAMDTRTGERA